MTEDTKKLLQECSSGVKMGVSALDEVLDKVKNEKLHQKLSDCRDKHARIGQETRTMLTENGQQDKEPDPMAKGMSWLKTNIKMTVESSDNTVADLITAGCDMGAKSLTRYLNQYEGAQEQAKQLARELIALEEKTSDDLRSYL